MIPTLTPNPALVTRDWPFNRTYIFSISLIAALGGLMFGYDWVVIGGAELFYEKYFKLTSALQVGWAMSSALVGAMAGAFFAGALSDKFGRKPLLLFSGFLFVGTSIGTGLAPTFPLFVASRLLGGMAIGIASNLSPLYIAEIAPAAMRGRLVSVNQLTIAIGVVAAQFVNWLIARPTPPGTAVDQIPFDSWNVQTAWRWMFGVTAVPAAFFLSPCSTRRKARVGSPRRAVRIVPGLSWGRSAVRTTPNSQ